MKKISTYIVAASTMLALAFNSCKSGDDDDFEPLIQEDKALVNSDVPGEGWSGNTENGILKYAPSEYDKEDPNTYFAFKMKDGVCEKAVINIVMYNTSQAKQFAQILNNGTWVDIDDEDEDEDEDDEEDEYYFRAEAKSHHIAFTYSLLKRISRYNASRSGYTLPIPVQQEGKVIYIYLPNMTGLYASDIEKAVNLWSGDYSIIPNHIIFGTYVNGVYTCNNMHGMNIDYVVETKFNTYGYCTKYTTTITLPSENWAELYYDAFEDQLWDFEQQFGQSPDLNITGKTVILDAVIVGNVTQEHIDSMIYSLDWLNNCPFIYSLFND